MFGLENLGLIGLFIGTFLAATIFPFSSDALYLAILAATGNTAGCLIVGTLGNWLGSVLTYWIGWIGKWEWIEKWFKVKPETLQKQKKKIDRYGVWLACYCWSGNSPVSSYGTSSTGCFRMFLLRYQDSNLDRQNQNL